MKRALILLALCACDAASSDPALDHVLEIPGAQFRPGAFPADTGGPAALQLATRHASVVIGRNDERATALLEPTARAAVYGIDGYDGTWIVPAGPADVSAPDNPTANIVYGVREDLAPGPFTLRVAAADATGAFGPSATADVVAADAERPSGELVVRLEWRGRADLDLHVIDGLGGEAWSDKPNTMPLPMVGTVVDPLEYKQHGILDHDGNKDCHVDGPVPDEDVVWTAVPPAGDYVVRVDARAMCGAPGAAWTASAYRGDDLIGAAVGFLAVDDTWGDHGAGAGVLALRFSL